MVLKVEMAGTFTIWTLPTLVTYFAGRILHSVPTGLSCETLTAFSFLHEGGFDGCNPEFLHVNSNHQHQVIRHV